MGFGRREGFEDCWVGCTIQLFEIILVYENNPKPIGDRIGPETSACADGDLHNGATVHKHGEPRRKFPISSRSKFNFVAAVFAEAARPRDLPRSTASIQLFILLLTVNLIYSTGNFLQNLFSHKALHFEYFIIKAYSIIVHILLVLILWRHYQLEEGTLHFI